VTWVTDAIVAYAHTPAHRPCGRFTSTQEFAMKTNVGGIDRILRLVLGLALIGLTLGGVIGAWGWLGLVLVGTAAVGFCPLYPLLGLNTCPMKKT
jgi:hypothetical protein